MALVAPLPGAYAVVTIDPITTLRLVGVGDDHIAAKECRQMVCGKYIACITKVRHTSLSLWQRLIESSHATGSTCCFPIAPSTSTSSYKVFFQTTHPRFIITRCLCPLSPTPFIPQGAARRRRFRHFPGTIVITRSPSTSRAGAQSPGPRTLLRAASRPTRRLYYAAS